MQKEWFIYSGFVQCVCLSWIGMSKAGVLQDRNLYLCYIDAPALGVGAKNLAVPFFFRIFAVWKRAKLFS